MQNIGVEWVAGVIHKGNAFLGPIFSWRSELKLAHLTARGRKQVPAGSRAEKRRKMETFLHQEKRMSNEIGR